MSSSNNSKPNFKGFYANKNRQRRQGRLNPRAQQVLLENATVNRIKGEIDYANAFIFRSFRLRLSMEEG
jgi:hypothetical protein